MYPQRLISHRFLPADYLSADSELNDREYVLFFLFFNFYHFVKNVHVYTVLNAKRQNRVCILINKVKIHGPSTLREKMIYTVFSLALFVVRVIVISL